MSSTSLKVSFIILSYRWIGHCNIHLHSGMVVFTQWGKVVDGQNTAVILREDKVEGGWQVTWPVSYG